MGYPSGFSNPETADVFMSIPPSTVSAAARAAADGFDEVYRPARSYLGYLDSFLDAQVEAFEPEVREQARYVLGHSGKRLRPLLVAYSGWEGSGAEGEMVRLGAVIELVHLATLVHDDILDGAGTRHRQETAAARYGAAEAVLIGDVLFSHALMLAAEFPTTEVCRRVARATARVCAGEISQTYRRGRTDGDRTSYFRVIELKTAELFEVSCRLGATVAGYPQDFCGAAARFGRHLGRAYQIFDDLADLYASEEVIGKTLGTDLAKGKLTLPVLVLLEKVSAAEREDLLTAYRAASPEAVGRLLRGLSEKPVFKEVAAIFEEELAEAEAALESFHELPPVPRLLALAGLVRAQLARIDTHLTRL